MSDIPIFHNGPAGAWRMERNSPLLMRPRAEIGGSRLRIYGAPIYTMTVGVEYPGFNLVARGGVRPYTFSVASYEIFWQDQSGHEIIWMDNSGNQIIWDSPYGVSPLSEVVWADQSNREVVWIDASGHEVVWVNNATEGSLGLPAGLTLNPVTGMVSGTPTNQGSYALRFIVTDARAQTAVTDIIVLNVLA